jgi:hypothetical protein
MKHSSIRTALLLHCAVLLASCGGGGASSSAQATLSGNWFGELQTAAGPVYYNETVIADSGAGLLLTHCNRTSERLTRNGSQLFDRDGQLYYLYVRDAATLASRPDLPFGSVMKKRSDAGRFDSGRATVTLASGDTVAATADVCAESGTAGFEDSLGNKVSPIIVTVSLPYRDSFIRVDIAFRQIGVGQYDVAGFEAFVRGAAGVASVMEFSSPALRSADGGEGYAIAAGTVQVSSYRRTGIVLSADLKTITGDPVRFSADVRLQPRSRLDAAQ